MHILRALRRRVRLFRLGAREGFKKNAPGVRRRSQSARRVRFFGARSGLATQGSKFPSGVANNRKFRKVPCSTIRFPKKLFNSKNLIVGRWRPKEFLTGRGHRRVRFFSARSGLATQGSNFYARKSRPRQRVRNLTRKFSNPFSLAPQRRPTRRNARTCCFSFREGREKNR